MRALFAGASTFLIVVAPGGSVHPDHCPTPSNAVVTDHFFSSASSDQGAVGDIVAIELSFTLLRENPELDAAGDPYSFGLLGCYDATSLELLDEVVYSEPFERAVFVSGFWPFDSTPGEDEGAFFLGFPPKEAISHMVPGEAFPLMTLYFRIQGEVGQSVEVRFCDDVRVGEACESNRLYYYNDTGPDFHTRSTLHVPGIVRILPGEPTRTEPPPTPPNAKVYPEAPTPEEASIHFELDGPLVVRPGAEDVPFDLYVTSNHEFSGFMTSLAFPPEYLELTGIEEHTRPGVVDVDNDLGGFGLLMSNSRRRVGLEKERVHLATLRFNVEEAASEASSLNLAFEPFGNFFNWLSIHHERGHAGELPTTSEVTPVAVAHALVRVQSGPVRTGDVNLDHGLDLTDAILILEHLFRGKEVPCPGAADFNDDRRVDISDPIAVLTHLFRGGAAPRAEVDCGA